MPFSLIHTGHAIPEGRTAYVVRLYVDGSGDGGFGGKSNDKKVTQKVLLNPVTGRSVCVCVRESV
jgi:hypothetical protein